MKPAQSTSLSRRGRRPRLSPLDRIGLSRAEAADFIGVPPHVFDQMVDDGRMPHPKDIDGRKVWSRLAIEKWFAELPEEPADRKRNNPWRDVE
jgi:predicted DNA-binding transcriptional regulator AlpA